MPTLRLAFFASASFLPMSVPSTRTVPLSGCRRPLRCCTSVDLPDPVCPASAVKLPASIVSETSERALRSNGVPRMYV